MLRYREQDFAALEHAGGITPAWPIAYAELEPWYGRAEGLFQVRGAAGQDPTEPRRSEAYPLRPGAGRAGHRRRPRAAGQARGCIRSRCRSPSTSTAGCSGRPRPGTPSPTPAAASCDAETARWRRRSRSPDVTLVTGAHVAAPAAGAGRPPRRGRRVSFKDGERRVIRAGTVVLSAGAVNSAALLLRSGGVANRSGVVGRYFMNHNCTAMLAVDPRVATTRSTRRRSASTTST